LLTGCHPGHHGVLHNAWYDRGLARRVVTESPETWQEAMQWLRPGIQTIHEALRASDPGACTLSVNEPADRGAGYSTFELFRTGRSRELAAAAPKPAPHVSEHFAESSEAYRWGSMVDSSAVTQAKSLLGGRFAGQDFGPPRFLWVNTSLTDASSHEAGPHSEMARAAVRDTDARIGDVLDAADRALGIENITVFVLADHGMEQNDPENTAEWGPALESAGISFMDEGGFLYFDTPSDAEVQ